MIHNIYEAVKRVCYLLEKMPNKVEDINDGRYKVLTFNDEKVLVKFTREHFFSFKKNAHGESVNTDDLNDAIEQGIKRVFIVYADDKTYMISPYTIKAQAEIRRTETEDKETYSFPIKLLIPIREFQEILIS